jgi:hypothetical protein
MNPWLVFGSQDGVIGPASCVGVLQATPAFVEEMNPTSSWQVEPQAVFGK